MTSSGQQNKPSESDHACGMSTGQQASPAQVTSFGQHHASGGKGF
jgi:hypothetical protein